MNFKDYLEVLSVKVPKTEFTINTDLNEYKQLITRSKLSHDKKAILENIHNEKEIPVFCQENNKCYMLNLKQKEIREVKSRDDKAMCGCLINALCINESNVDKYKNIKWSWEMPSCIWRTI